MFFEILKMRMKILSRNRILLFWGLIFPLFLVTCLFLGTHEQNKSLNSDYTVYEVVEDSSLIQYRFIDPSGEKDHISYYFAMIASIIVIAGLMGTREIEDNLPGISPSAVRIAVSPISRKLVLEAGICSVWMLGSLYIAIAITYIKIILGISLKGPLVGWCILIVLSTLYSTITGMFIGALTKHSRAVKQGEVAVFGLAGAVLAGLVDEGMKFKVDLYFPILGKVNPEAIIVEGMLDLSQNGISLEFMSDMIRLFVITAIFFIGMLLLIRRQSR